MKLFEDWIDNSDGTSIDREIVDFYMHLSLGDDRPLMSKPFMTPESILSVITNMRVSDIVELSTEDLIKKVQEWISDIRNFCNISKPECGERCRHRKDVYLN